MFSGDFNTITIVSFVVISTSGFTTCFKGVLFFAWIYLYLIECVICCRVDRQAMEGVRPSRRRPSMAQYPSADHVNNNHIKQAATSTANANRQVATSSGRHVPLSPSQHQLLQQQQIHQQLLYHQQLQQQHREKAKTEAMYIDSKKNMVSILC